MERIEEIKTRITNYENAYDRTEEENAYRKIDEYCVFDIKYLLSLIDTQKKEIERLMQTLDRIHEIETKFDERSLQNAMIEIYRITDEALKQE